MKELPQGKKESFCNRLLEYALIHRQTGRGPGRAAAQKQGNGSFPLIGDVGPSGGPSPSCVRARARALPGACVCSGNAPQARATLPTLPPSCDGRDSVRRPAGPSGGGAERRPGSRLRGRHRFRRRTGAGPRSSERAGSARKPSDVAGASTELKMRSATGMPAGGGARTPAPRRGESLRACCA